MDELLRQIVDWDRAFALRRARRVGQSRFGPAIFDDQLPRVWYLNTLLLDLGVRASADELIDEADRVQAELRHRKLSVDEGDYGAELEPELRERGWRIEELVVMPHIGSGRSVDTSNVVEVDIASLEPLWTESGRAEPWGREEETLRQLVAARRRTAEALSVRYFAVHADGQVASCCELYSAEGIGQIESVVTLERFRNRGFGAAVTMRALEESRAAGHDLTFLVADARDWPREWYGRLGFAEIGRIWDFVREAEPAPSDPT